MSSCSARRCLLFRRLPLMSNLPKRFQRPFTLITEIPKSCKPTGALPKTLSPSYPENPGDSQFYPKPGPNYQKEPKHIPFNYLGDRFVLPTSSQANNQSDAYSVYCTAVEQNGLYRKLTGLENRLSYSNLYSEGADVEECLWGIISSLLDGTDERVVLVHRLRFMSTLLQYLLSAASLGNLEAAVRTIESIPLVNNLLTLLPSLPPSSWNRVSLQSVVDMQILLFTRHSLRIPPLLATLCLAFQERALFADYQTLIQWADSALILDIDCDEVLFNLERKFLALPAKKLRLTLPVFGYYLTRLSSVSYVVRHRFCSLIRNHFSFSSYSWDETILLLFAVNCMEIQLGEAYGVLVPEVLARVREKSELSDFEEMTISHFCAGIGRDVIMNVT